MDLITIIVPIYNCEKYLNRCIESIQKQTYKNIEIILVNDGSTDKSKEICMDFAKKDKRIKVINIDNGGVSRARNIGIKNAKGKYIGFVDADDWIEKDMYESLYTNMKKYNANFSICEKITESDDDMLIRELENQVDDIVLLSKGQAIDCIFKDCNKCYGGYVFNKLYKKKIILNNQENIFFDEDIKISEDSLFVFRYMMNCQNLKTIYNKRQYYHYIERKNSALREKYNNKKNTVIDAYERIINIADKNMEIIKKENINLDNIKRLYIKSNNNILNQMKRYNVLNKENKKMLNKNANKYFIEVLKSNKIKIVYKLDLFFNTKFPYIYEKIRKQF